MRNSRAFTLIEMLVVVSIIALLLGIMMPSLKEVRRLSRRTVCQKNLDQIGVAMQAYLLNSTPRDTFPYAGRLPSWEQSQPRPLPPLSEVLKNELPANKLVQVSNSDNMTIRTNTVFACPADQNTMAREGDPDIAVGEGIPTDRYFDHEGTSYEWESNLNGTKLDFKLIRIYGRVGYDDSRTRKVELARIHRNQMWMLYDFEAFHGGPNMRGSHNVLYTDLHVESDKWDQDKKVGQAMN
jgi:prepilin-type N-terminal cleavage/methylation domain-containing protein